MVRLVNLEGEESVRKLALVYVNRLSDWFFVMGRWVCACFGSFRIIVGAFSRRNQSDGIADLIKKINSNDNDFSMLD